MKNELERYYWDQSVIQKVINRDPAHAALLDPMLVNSGKRYQIVTSVLATPLVLHRLDGESGDFELAQTELLSLWQDADVPIERVAFHELIADGLTELLLRARAQGWELPLDIAIELATADWLKVKKFHTFNDDLEKYEPITKTLFSISKPALDQGMLALQLPANHNRRDSAGVMHSESADSQPRIDTSTGAKAAGSDAAISTTAQRLSELTRAMKGDQGKAPRKLR